MSSYDDCIGLSDPSEEEVAAIAEHEHIPMMAAAALGHYLVHRENGEAAVRRMILDDIEAARARCNFRHATQLKLALRHFVETHPGAGVGRAGTG